MLRGFISLLLIAILLYIMRDKYSQIVKALGNANPLLILTGLLAFICAISIASVRLKLIVDAQENIPINFREALSLTFIGYFFNNFLPTSIGGDVMKAYYLSKKTSEKTGPFAAVFVDRIIGLITMIFMAFIAILLVGNRVIDSTTQKMIYLITLFAALGILFMTNKSFAKKFSIVLRFLKPVEDKLRKAYHGIHKYKHHKILILQSLIISTISQVMFFVTIGILALSIGVRIPGLEILLRMPIISMMSLLPSINGLGVRESSTVLLFKSFIGTENAFVVSILWLFILFLVSLAGGVIYAVSPQFKVSLRQIEEEEDSVA